MQHQQQALEYITVAEGPEEIWVCICKNTVFNVGFCTCNQQGDEIEPQYEENKLDDYYRCEHCGRIIQADTLAVVGKWPVDDRPTA